MSFSLCFSLLLFGEPTQLVGPFSHENLTLYLIVGEETAPGTDLVPLDDAMQKELLVVHETHNVNELAVENKGDRPVFIQAGDIVKGGNQDRVLAVDLVVPSKSGKLPIVAYCVEKGRWHKRGDEAEEYFIASPQRLAGKSLKRMVKKESTTQGEVWKEIHSEDEKLRQNVAGYTSNEVSPTSYQLKLEDPQLRAENAEYVARLAGIIERHDRAVGFVTCINGRFSGAEVYGTQALFRKLWPRMLDAAVTEAIAEKEAKPEGPRDDEWRMEVLTLVGKEGPTRQPYENTVYQEHIGNTLLRYDTELAADGRVIHRSWDVREKK